MGRGYRNWAPGGVREGRAWDLGPLRLSGAGAVARVGGENGGGGVIEILWGRNRDPAPDRAPVYPVHHNDQSRIG